MAYVDSANNQLKWLTLQLLLTDVQGRPVGIQLVERADAVERQRLWPSYQAGKVILLQVNTASQTQTVKLIRE